MLNKIIHPVAMAAVVFFGSQPVMAQSLLMPNFDAELGRSLFASKGCAVCHAVNGVGGEDASPLDYDPASGPMDPFDFAAKMWRGAEPMIYMQQDELGQQIELTGPELAAIIAFAHDLEQQALFSKDDIPEEIAALMHEGIDDGDPAHNEDADGDGVPDKDEGH